MLREMMQDDEGASGRVDEFLHDFDHRSEFFKSHFFNITKVIAQKAPVLTSGRHGGFKVVSSYSVTQKVSAQPQNFISTSDTQSIPRSTAMPWLIPSMMNPPDHGFYRAILNPQFTPASIAKHEERAESLIRTLLNRAAEAGKIELIRDVAMPFTGRTSFNLFGFDPDDWPVYNDALHNGTYEIGTLVQRAAGWKAYADAAAATVGELIRHPRAGSVVAALCASEKDGRKLNEAEISAVMNNLIIGGLGTTQAAIGTATVWLARNPDRRKELIEDPTLIPAAVNEFIRAFSPSPFSGREVAQDTELEGFSFKKGEAVLLFRSGSNMDPAFIDRPMEIDFRRKSSRLLSLGLGPHLCLGQHLARLEFRVYLSVLLQLAPNFELDDDGPKLPPNFGASVAFTEVPIRFSRG